MRRFDEGQNHYHFGKANDGSCIERGYSEIRGMLLPEFFRGLFSHEKSVGSYAWGVRTAGEFRLLLSRYDGSNVEGGGVWCICNTSAPEQSENLRHDCRAILCERFPAGTKINSGIGCKNDFPHEYIILQVFLVSRDSLRPPLPPMPEHIEPLILAIAQSFPDFSKQLLEGVKPADFRDRRHRLIFEGFIEGQRTGEPLSQVLFSGNTMGEVGGREYLDMLRHLAPGGCNAESLDRLIKDLKMCA
ncbi:MAG: hypothetical protein HQM09_17570 [Candidatus Riflebacteria bacterium]|nr:hypothetical protein [Candidatus Riflebacteria bacterium]